VCVSLSLSRPPLERLLGGGCKWGSDHCTAIALCYPHTYAMNKNNHAIILFKERELSERGGWGCGWCVS
jgi:hypothetical protein